MAKPFDVSKYRKSLTKSIPGISSGFRDPSTWISTGNYCLNYLISGDFYKGVPLSKVVCFAGESGCLPAEATIKVQLKGVAPELTLTVMDLKNLYMSDPTIAKVLTPDGYQSIGQWYDKGVLPMVSIKATTHSTICATNHLIQASSGDWILAKDLKVGDYVRTILGTEKIESIKESEPVECYDFEILHENHRYYGDGFVSHNSGKSLIVSGNIVKHAQDQGIFVVLLDSENALDENWLKALGVDTSPEKLLKIGVCMVDDVAKIISDFMSNYKTDYAGMEDAPKILFVLDSLGMLLTPTDVSQFEKGDMKGDMGRKPKALTALVRNIVNLIANYDVGLIATNHTYASADMFDPEDKISGGQGFIYASSIVVASKKKKLKETEQGVKGSDVLGIKSVCKVVKSRFAKPFESVDIYIPYETGMDPYSGLFDLFLSTGVMEKVNNRYRYVSKETGEETVLYRKEWRGPQFDIIMREFPLHVHVVSNDEDDSVQDDDLSSDDN